jgi:DDE_Tnp_1-associated
MSLIEHLKQIRDFRTQPKYPLWVVLVLVLMGTMSGCLGYRALADFTARHQAVLLELMALPHKRLPSYSTIRRVLTRMDFAAFTQAFNAWAREMLEVPAGALVPVDGKSIRASVEEYDSAYQDFVSVVSAFCTQPGVVIGLQSMRNGSESEIRTVQTLLGVLQLEGVCFSLDALHTQKNS